MTWRVIHADCIEAMRETDESSVDAIVTDPPYSLSFMGRTWDTNFGHDAWAAEALRVLKPGGHLLAFGGTRTYHRLACALEDAGFEIRDCLAWLYGSGFPKSLDVSKAIDKAAGAAREVVGQYRAPDGKGRWGGNTFSVGEPPDGRGESDLTVPATPDAERWQGWGTALKPAFEPIVLARKPLSGTVAQNVLEYGTGALNVDGTRIGFRDDADEAESKEKNRHADFGTEPGGNEVYGDFSMVERKNYEAPGRWPANVLLDPEAAEILDEQSGESKDGVAVRHRSGGNTFGGDSPKPPMDDMTYAGGGGASRFFYTAKTSRSERERGVREYGENDRNGHPTVKPVDLMQWLCRLITQPKGLVLDPFLGSGSTGIAALREGFDFIGIEREAEYVEIARARIIGDAPLLNVGAEA